ncbi:hypothetical protein BH10PSE7_BH10PSE7_26240 [soil metagenome]
MGLQSVRTDLTPNPDDSIAALVDGDIIIFDESGGQIFDADGASLARRASSSIAYTQGATVLGNCCLQYFEEYRLWE